MKDKIKFGIITLLVWVIVASVALSLIGPIHIVFHPLNKEDWRFIRVAVVTFGSFIAVICTLIAWMEWDIERLDCIIDKTESEPEKKVE